MRWRYSGTNWEGRKWTASEAVAKLGTQVDAAQPIGHATDGTVAGKAHDQVNPSSDHRPHPFSGPGIVRAIDIGVNPGDPLAENLRLNEDPRIKYVIHQGRTFSGVDSSMPFVWRDYDGPNPHDTHIHVSVLTTADNNTSEWNIEGGDDMASSAQKMWVDFAFNAMPNEFKGDPNFWYNLAEADAQWDTAFRPALSKGAQALFKNQLKRNDTVKLV